MNNSDTTRAVAKRLGGLPPDPDGMNDRRTELAECALVPFMFATGTDREYAVADLITNLAHWCDRNNQDFQSELERGLSNYNDETTAE